MAHGHPVVVGIDGSAVSRRALAWAAEEASLRTARLVVLHAWHPPYVPEVGWVHVDSAAFEDAAERLLAQAVRAAEGHGAVTEGRLLRGSAAAALIEASDGAALIVLRSRGHGGFAGLLLGSVSQQVVHHACCPVVVVPPERRH